MTTKRTQVGANKTGRRQMDRAGRPRFILLLDAAVGARRRFWTRAAYERATALGMFGSEDRIELIEGEIIDKMPQNTPHATGINLTQEAVREAFGKGVVIRIQQPLSVGDFSQPEPDIAVVKGAPRDYEDAHPTTALLVVEVSDSTLAFDRLKAGLYARAAVREYCILNLADRVLEVHRDPARMGDEPYGYGYRSIERLTESDLFSPLTVSGAGISVVNLLPSHRSRTSA